MTSAGSLLTTEAGGTASFQVALSWAPTSDVTIQLSSSDGTEGTLRTTTLVFTAADWLTPQTVTVQSMDDTLVDGRQAHTIQMTSPSADPDFHGLTGPRVAIQNGDNDVAPQATGSPVTYQAAAGGMVNRYNHVVAPTVVGTQSAINASDDQRLAITEGSYTTGPGGTAITLDSYRWTFENLNQATQMVFEGYRTTNTNTDDFWIQYSATGPGWTTAFLVNNVTENTYTFNLPSAVSGRMFVRVIDTKAGTLDKEYDTLFVDRLAFVGAAAAPAQGVADPIIGGGTGLAPATPVLALAAAPLSMRPPLTPSELLGSPFPAAGFSVTSATPWLVPPSPCCDGIPHAVKATRSKSRCSSAAALGSGDRLRIRERRSAPVTVAQRGGSGATPRSARPAPRNA